MRLGLVFFLVAVALGCSPLSDLPGAYQADHQGLNGKVRVVMVMAEDGSGKWEISGENVPFLWRERAGVVLIHTREGGVVEGQVESRGLRMDVPGVGKLLFVRKSPSDSGPQ